MYWRRARIVVPKFSPNTMLNSSTTVQFITSACLLPILCCTLFSLLFSTLQTILKIF